MLKKFVLISSLTLSFIACSVGYASRLTVDNKIKCEMPAWAVIQMNNAKYSVPANNKVSFNLDTNKLINFKVNGMAVGNTFQTHVDSDCNSNLMLKADSNITIELHAPPKDEAGYGMRISCIYR